MLNRRLALMLPFGLLACSRDERPAPLAPLAYGHLLPLRLNVATLSVNEANPPVRPDDAGRLLQVSPAEAVRIMGRQRLLAVGTGGEAVFTVTVASMVQGGGNLTCVVGCRLDVMSGQGERQGFIEAEARAQNSLSDRAAADSRARTGETLLRRAMDQLNVEFEFQLRRNLRDWLVEAAPGSPGGLAAPSTQPVLREDLSGGGAAGSSMPTTEAPPGLTPPVMNTPSLLAPMPAPVAPPPVVPPPAAPVSPPLLPGQFLQLPR